jgi:hypothetical protein
MEAKEIFNNLPQWSKGAVAVAVVAGIGIIGFAIYRKVKLIQEKAESNETANSAEDAYLKLKKKGGAEGKLSYPETNYFSAATAIKKSLDGCETYVGEEDAARAVLNVVKKPIDWFYLVNVFGSRKIDGCAFGGDEVYALPELLNIQLGNLCASVWYTNTCLGWLKDELKKRGVEI